MFRFPRFLPLCSELRLLFSVMPRFVPICQQLRFGVFREGVSKKMPALEGQFLKEISVRFAGENPLRTQKKTQNKALRRGS